MVQSDGSYSIEITDLELSVLRLCLKEAEREGALEYSELSYVEEAGDFSAEKEVEVRASYKSLCAKVEEPHGTQIRRA